MYRGFNAVVHVPWLFWLVSYPDSTKPLCIRLHLELHGMMIGNDSCNMRVSLVPKPYPLKQSGGPSQISLASAHFYNSVT